LALTGGFTGATLGWIVWGIMTPGDAFANGSSFVEATVLALGALGGYAAFKARSRWARISTALVSVLCAAFWVAVPDGWWAKPPPPRASDSQVVPTADELREIERETSITLPASTHVLIWKANRGHDPYLQLKFEMATADWAAFVAASPFRDRYLGEDAGARLGVDYGAWAPDSVAHLVKGEFRVPDVLDLNLGADMSRPDVVVVYLVWHQT
jgi:hypothetical protein